MKKIIFYKNIVFCLLMSVTTTGCNRDKNNGYDENVAKEKFCSCLNVENIDQTIPVVDKFLSGLSDGLNDEQQLQELTTWLKSCSCIIDATVFCKSCVETNPPKSQIAVSFDENGTTKNFILEITMSNPLRAAGYHEYKKIPSWDYFLPGPWYWNERLWHGEFIPFNKVIVINSTEDLKTYITNSEEYRDFSDIDFSEHSLLLVSGLNPDQLFISDISGSLRQTETNYVLHIDVKRYNVRNDTWSTMWFFAIMTVKLSEESDIETSISYSENENEYFYYAFDKKCFLQQRQDKIYLKFVSDVGKEQILSIVNSDVSLTLGFTYMFYNNLETHLENYFLRGWNVWLVLETKDGGRIPSSTLESFKSREEIVLASYMFGDHNSCPFAMVDEFMVILKPTTSYAQLLELVEQNDCTVSDKDTFQKNEFVLCVSKTSKSDAMQMANLFYETGLFEWSVPNFVFFSILH